MVTAVDIQTAILNAVKAYFTGVKGEELAEAKLLIVRETVPVLLSARREETKPSLIEDYVNAVSNGEEGQRNSALEYLAKLPHGAYPEMLQRLADTFTLAAYSLNHLEETAVLRYIKDKYLPDAEIGMRENSVGENETLELWFRAGGNVDRRGVNLHDGSARLWNWLSSREVIYAVPKDAQISIKLDWYQLINNALIDNAHTSPVERSGISPADFEEQLEGLVNEAKAAVVNLFEKQLGHVGEGIIRSHRPPTYEVTFTEGRIEGEGRNVSLTLTTYSPGVESLVKLMAEERVAPK